MIWHMCVHDYDEGIGHELCVLCPIVLLENFDGRAGVSVKSVKLSLS